MLLRALSRKILLFENKIKLFLDRRSVPGIVFVQEHQKFVDNLKDQFMIQCHTLGCTVPHSLNCCLGTSLPPQLKSSCVTLTSQ